VRVVRKLGEAEIEGGSAAASSGARITQELRSTARRTVQSAAIGGKSLPAEA
jgi:hypothetical protein